ncbi:MAG: sn-glycerol-3-phosphate ABC transporter ATP-binding protein UgpC [Hyphomicrobiaceae bacterium]|nr:sn-glycerol-3-phosphate ABC transporter ATP-binding protein UgpC [Hyphomicrobiaceae bacterium]
MAPISIRRVTKAFGKTEVIRGVDLEIENGSFVVVLGPSGCGKSTLLRMIAGLEAISGGEIAIDGKVVNDLEPRQRGCAMVFQNYALYPHMTVAENIGYGLKVSGMPSSERRARIDTVAAALGLTDFLARKPGQLSGGQRQRVAMGRAMIREPKVFLFDEPLSNLDAKLRVAMRIEIRKLHQRLAATSVFVTHDQVEAMTLADRLLVMNRGVIEQVGSPLEIYHRPATTFVAGFIGAPGMNLIEATVTADGLRLADGQVLPLDHRRYPHLVTETAVTVGIRAEAIAIGTGDGIIATFDFAEELGNGRHIHLEIASTSLVAHIDSLAVFAPRARVPLVISPRAIHLFDPVTGRRLPEAVVEQIPTAVASFGEPLPA